MSYQLLKCACVLGTPNVSDPVALFGMKYNCPQELLANVILGHCVWTLMSLIQSH